MRGAIEYMARNRVLANLFMGFVMAGGLWASTCGEQLTYEVFPEIELERVTVTARYPGASPREVEKGLVQPIEEAVVINVYRVGQEGPREVSQAVRAYLAKRRQELPPSVSLDIVNDRTQMFEQRMTLLLENIGLGLLLVILLLGLLLRLRRWFLRESRS
jgi:multidrug efflux pump subunit AcrB